jgi:type IV pilus assembly protein PilX
MMTNRMSTRQARQRGASLIFALITLVALMLAAIALVRSVDSGSKILGNIGFQQDAIASADIGTSEATAFLISGADLTVSSGGTSNTAAADSRSGFYALAKDPLDATGQQLTSATDASTRQLVDWDLDGCQYAAPNIPATRCAIIPHDVNMSGSTSAARYVILRLCQADGAVSSGSCSQPLTSSASGGAARGACEGQNDGCTRLGSTAGKYFRIVVRVVGARGTTSFTETIVQY